MKKTPFAGLTILEPGEGLDTDSGAFIDRDRLISDRLLQLGAKLHRHSGLSGLANPSTAPSASVIASAGTIAPELTVSIGFTLEDSQLGETELSPLSTVTTGSPMTIPPAAPSGVIDYTGGALLVNTYYYATTFIDGEGGETPAGPVIGVERQPGFASGRVQLSNLTYGMAGAGAQGWRLYRSIGGGSMCLLTTGGIGTDTFTDDGSLGVDCDVHPPNDAVNTTRRVNTLRVDLPKADANMASAAFINVYGTISGDFGGASLLGQYPISSAGKAVFYSSLEFNDAAPPDVNLSIGTASQIDPDTELLENRWKRPVATSALLPVVSTVADVRLALSENEPFIFTGSGWRRFQHHLIGRELSTGVTHTLQVMDDGGALDINSNSDVTVRVPADAVVGLPTGAQVELARIGSGQVAITASGGVTLHSRAGGGSALISAQFGVAHLRKRAPNNWLLYGDLT